MGLIGNKIMDVHKILETASKLHIAVVGDLITDKYIYGDVTRISPEAPVPLLNVTGTRESLGGAGNVAQNLRELRCKVSFFFDKDNYISKTRVISNGHHMLRIDDEEESPKWMRWENISYELEAGIAFRDFDCVIISDYGKGMISPEVASKTIEACNIYGIPVVVDTKRNQPLMTGATVLKCNQKEWDSFNHGSTEDTWDWMIRERIANLVVTQGERGLHYRGIEDDIHWSGTLPGYPIHLSDPCGAGDTVTAVLGIMLALGYNIEDACILANIAASEVCRHPGVHAIQKHELIARYHELYTDPTSIHSVRVQPDAATAQNPDQTHLEGKDGASDEGTTEGQQPVDAGGSSEPQP